MTNDDILSDACCDKAQEIIQRTIADRSARLIQEFSEICDTLDSPIEEILAAQLFAYRDSPENGPESIDIRIDPRVSLEQALLWAKGTEWGISIYTDAKIGPYTPDFFIVSTCGWKLKLIDVECDGADFHNGHDQVARDKKRDRFMAENSIAVLRFTGSEIFRDPAACVREILKIAGA